MQEDQRRRRWRLSRKTTIIVGGIVYFFYPALDEDVRNYAMTADWLLLFNALAAWMAGLCGIIVAGVVVRQLIDITETIRAFPQHLTDTLKNDPSLTGLTKEVGKLRQGVEDLNATAKEAGRTLVNHGSKLDGLGSKLDGLGSKLDGHGSKLDSTGSKLERTSEKLDQIVND